MSEAIHADTTLSMPEWCIVRPQESRYLFYNSRTDELHLVSPSGFYLVQLCNGLRSVHEVEALLAEGLGMNLSAVEQRVRRFLGDMVARGLLEADHVN